MIRSYSMIGDQLNILQIIFTALRVWMDEYPGEFNRFDIIKSGMYFKERDNKKINAKLQKKFNHLVEKLESESLLDIRELDGGHLKATDSLDSELIVDNVKSSQLESSWNDNKKRFLGSIQADIWCTRPGSFVEYNEQLTFERPSKFKNDNVVRVKNSKGVSFARTDEYDSIFISTLLDAQIAVFDATVVFFESDKQKVGSTITIQLNCYLLKTAFSQTASFPIDSKGYALDESKESMEERFMRLRQQSLMAMFKKLGTNVDSISEESEDCDVDLSKDQLDIFYKDGLKDSQFEPEFETDAPSTFSLNLFPYQKRGLTWMLNRELLSDSKDVDMLSTHPLWTQLKWPEGDDFWINFNSGELSLERPTLALKCRGGILADDMGLGKTIMTLSLIFSSEPGCTLIVTPTTLLAQWESEIKKVSLDPNFCGCFVYYRTSTTSKSLQSQLKNFIHFSHYRIKIVLTTYGTVSSEHKLGQGLLFNTTFDRIILDEAHHIKNRNTQAAKSCFDLHGPRRWALTGTPVVNRLEDLYSLIRFIGIEPWNNFAFWRAFITTKFQNIDTRELAMKTVQAVVSPICLRRTKEMTDPSTGRPLVELPSKTVEIKRVRFSEEEKVLYSYIYARVQTSVQKKMRDGTATSKYTAILSLLLRLRQVCCHPLMLKSIGNDDTELPLTNDDPVKTEDDDMKLKLTGDIEEMLEYFAKTPSFVYTSEMLKSVLENPLENQECVICSELHSDPVLTECMHAACRDCMTSLIEHLKKKQESLLCPICRGPISANRLFTVDVENKKLIPLFNGPQSTKIRALVNALREAAAKGMGKSVVFSQFTSFLDLIQVNLTDLGFTVFRFDGSMTPAQRSEAQECFKNSQDKNAILLLSQKAGGVGLNLVAANHAYLMDPWWNYASESQAIDRIYRLGQTHNVTITRFIIQGSIEERILKIQEHKRVLSSLVTEEERRAENLENIRMLFEIDDITNEL